MNKFVWLGLGAVGGFIVAAAIGFVVVNVMIPWEDVCAVLVPAQVLADTGSRLMIQLQEWLTTAENFLATLGGSEEEAGEVKTGLAGLLDKAKEVTGEVTAAVTRVLVLPLQALIELAKVVLGQVQESVDAARNVMAGIDAARCN